MPFEENLTDIYAHHVQKPLQDIGFSVTRGDDISLPSVIIKQVWESICRSEVIIADLTHKNPNVFYETGLAHAIGKPTILIAQRDGFTPTAFDLNSVRTILYETTPTGFKQLTQKILKVVANLPSQAERI